MCSEGFVFYCIILPEGDPDAFGFLVFRHDFVNRYVVGYSAAPQVQESKFYIGNAPFEGVGEDGTIKMSQVVTTDAQPGIYDTMTSQAPMIEVLKRTA